MKNLPIKTLIQSTLKQKKEVKRSNIQKNTGSLFFYPKSLVALPATHRLSSNTKTQSLSLSLISKIDRLHSQTIALHLLRSRTAPSSFSASSVQPMTSSSSSPSSLRSSSRTAPLFLSIAQRNQYSAPLTDCLLPFPSLLKNRSRCICVEKRFLCSCVKSNSAA